MVREPRRSRFIDGARIEKPSVHSGAHELLDLDSRNPQSGGGLGPIFREQRARDIVAVARAFLAGMARRHPIAVAIKQHPGEEARLARSSAASVPGGIAGELLLNGIPQRLIDDRRVFAGMELALVNDLAAIGAVLQHLVERAPRERLPADEAPGSARPRDLLLIPRASSSAFNKRTEPSSA